MAMSSSRPKIPLEYIGFFNQTGYGQSATSNVFALENSARYDVRIRGLHGLPARDAFSKEDYERLGRLGIKPENDRAFQVLHCIPDMFRRARPCNKRIALATFETFQPPDDWIKLLNRCDTVICPSTFNKNQFEKGGVEKPIFVLPHVLNFDIWNERVSSMSSDDCFTFLFVGTWRRRKGYEVLLEAWMSEFGPNEPVRLIIKTDKTNEAMEEVRLFKRDLGKKEIAPISFERRVFNEQQMASFVKSANCYVSPTMGEGFGLPALQAMALKVPVIVTNFSGCQEYAKQDNCTLLEPSGFLVHESIDPIPQFANKKWPRIKVSTVQEAMRGVFEKYKQAQEKADKAYEFVQKNFNYGIFVSKFDEMMETVYSGSNAQNKAIQRHPRRI
jgi:glycosyltransferase involved in cell wall biosynthesis